MKSIRFKGQSANVFGEIFDNPQEMLTILLHRPHVFDDDFLREDSRGSRWNGFRNGRELMEDFQKSKVKGDVVKTIKNGIKAVNTDKKYATFNNIVGFAPNVPLYLMNVPTSMIDQRQVVKKAKVINLFVNISTCGSYGPDEIAEAGKELVSYIASLEQAGYRVGLTTFWGTFNDEDTVTLVGLRVKEPSQPLDIIRCAYPLVNPAFHRGICYGWYQRTAGFHHSPWYGMPPSSKSSYAPDIAKALNVQNGKVVYFSDILSYGNKAIDKAIGMDRNGPIRV